MKTISATVQWDFPVGHSPYLLSQRPWNHCRLIHALNLWILLLESNSSTLRWDEEKKQQSEDMPVNPTPQHYPSEAAELITLD